MTKVFIGGSRRITRLSSEVRRRLDGFVAKNLPIVVGDAPGVDKSIQQYLHEKGYRDVEVFCSGDRCRNNLGNWPTRKVAVNSSRRDFDFYATKDLLMSEEASFGLMIWDGESAGTLMNALRLIKQNKRVEIFEAPKHRFQELQGESDWNEFFSACNDEVRHRIEKLSASESKVAAPVQASLL
jgi:adenine-specific DNA-methyltransferase